MSRTLLKVAIALVALALLWKLAASADGSASGEPSGPWKAVLRELADPDSDEE